MTTLTYQETIDRMKHVPSWAHHAKTIARTFQFTGFMPAISFVRRIAKCAEELDHHPDINVQFDRVTLTLTTDSAGGLTEKDFTLAGQADQIATKFLEPAVRTV